MTAQPHMAAQTLVPEGQTRRDLELPRRAWRSRAVMRAPGPHCPHAATGSTLPGSCPLQAEGVWAPIGLWPQGPLQARLPASSPLPSQRIEHRAPQGPSAAHAAHGWPLLERRTLKFGVCCPLLKVTAGSRLGRKDTTLSSSQDCAFAFPGKPSAPISHRPLRSLKVSPPPSHSKPHLLTCPLSQHGR